MNRLLWEMMTSPGTGETKGHSLSLAWELSGVAGSSLKVPSQAHLKEKRVYYHVGSPLKKTCAGV